MRRVSTSLTSCLIALLAAVAVQAQAPRKVRVDFKETTLKNGLRVITVEDHSAPVISISVNYNVGSRDERRGRTGFAHLFEHLMFNGSENHPGEFFEPFEMVGATDMNGTTNEDRTLYFEALPANQLELALYLEADRMRSLAITKENLDNQRNAVQEERRRGLDNQPYGKSGEIQQELLYDNFAYKHSVIGSMEDLTAASYEDVVAFFRTWYAPNNAVLSIAGDFDSTEARELVRRYFGPIPRGGGKPPLPDMTLPARFGTWLRTTVPDEVMLPRLFLAFRSPVFGSDEYYAASLATAILGLGKGSRLQRILIREREVASEATAFTFDLSKGSDLLVLDVTGRPEVTGEAIEAAVADAREVPIDEDGAAVDEAEVVAAHVEVEQSLAVELRRLTGAHELG